MYQPTHQRQVNFTAINLISNTFKRILKFSPRVFFQAVLASVDDELPFCHTMLYTVLCSLIKTELEFRFFFVTICVVGNLCAPFPRHLIGDLSPALVVG